MNFASLATYKIVSGNPFDISGYLKKGLDYCRKNGLSAVYYYSNQTEKQLYLLSIWLSKESYQSCQDNLRIKNDLTSQLEVELINTESYEMVWDFQRSHLQYSYSQFYQVETARADQLEPALAYLREFARQKVFPLPCLVSCWLGRSNQSERHFLARVDWVNETAYLESIKEYVPVVEEQKAQAYGIQIRRIRNELLDSASFSSAGYGKINPDSYMS